MDSRSEGGGPGGLELLGPERDGHWDPRLLSLDGGWGASADS